MKDREFTKYQKKNTFKLISFLKYLIKTPLCINCKIIILCTQTHFSHVKEHI
jgi:hypothetical protein